MCLVLHPQADLMMLRAGLLTLLLFDISVKKGI